MRAPLGGSARTEREAGGVDQGADITTPRPRDLSLEGPGRTAAAAEGLVQSRPSVLGLKALAPALIALCLACGGGQAARAAAMRDQNAKLKSQIAVADESARVGQAYADQLTGAAGAPPLSLVYTPADVQQMAAAVLPYKMSAKSFNSQLAGEIHVEQITDIRLHPGNRLTCRVHYRGVGIRVLASVPAPYQAEVKRFIDGVQAGVVSELEVTLNTSGNVVIARATAKRSALKKNRDSGNEARLTRELNDRVLRKGLAFDVGITGAAQKVFGVTTTQSHVVVVYR